VVLERVKGGERRVIRRGGRHSTSRQLNSITATKRNSQILREEYPPRAYLLPMAFVGVPRVNLRVNIELSIFK